MSRSRLILAAALVVGLVIWFIIPSEELPLGYTDTAPHLKDVLGKRPNVKISVGDKYLKSILLTVNGQDVQQEELILPRGAEVELQGRMEFDLGRHGEFGLSRISIASSSKNMQGFLIEGEMLLHGSLAHVSGTPFGFDISKKWRIPDREGEFLLLVDYFANEPDEMMSRRFAVVCPVIVK